MSMLLLMHGLIELSSEERVNDQLYKEELLYYTLYRQPLYSGAWVRL